MAIAWGSEGQGKRGEKGDREDRVSSTKGSPSLNWKLKISWWVWDRVEGLLLHILILRSLKQLDA